MPFTPESVQLTEAGPGKPYLWTMTRELTWTGTFRGKVGRLLVPATVGAPFETDLASVPRFLTWLFPRYGKYTKAAVLHDYLCQSAGKETIAVYPTRDEGGDAATAGPELLRLRDRSDADEIFRLVMTELGVPWARRWLMWSAVSWATLLTSIVPGRRSKPLLRWAGRAILLAAVIAGALLAIAGGLDSIAAAAGAAIAFAGTVLAAGYVAQGRWDRWLVYLAALGMTVASIPLVAAGIAIGVLLVFYLLFEDLFSGFRGTRAWLARLVRPGPAVPTSPRAERIEAVRES